MLHTITSGPSCSRQPFRGTVPSTRRHRLAVFRRPRRRFIIRRHHYRTRSFQPTLITRRHSDVTTLIPTDGIIFKSTRYFVAVGQQPTTTSSRIIASDAEPKVIRWWTPLRRRSLRFDTSPSPRHLHRRCSRAKFWINKSMQSYNCSNCYRKLMPLYPEHCLNACI